MVLTSSELQSKVVLFHILQTGIYGAGWPLNTTDCFLFQDLPSQHLTKIYFIQRFLSIPAYRQTNIPTNQEKSITSLMEVAYKTVKTEDPGQQRQSVSSRMSLCVTNHNWTTRKQRLHLQSVAGISRHSALSEDRIQQCGTSSGSRHSEGNKREKLSDFTREVTSMEKP